MTILKNNVIIVARETGGTERAKTRLFARRGTIVLVDSRENPPANAFNNP